jgi:8-oxo-dGTP pyrophosphatase MutT (NUDIX family)
MFDIERSASSLFGVVTYGVHMTAYTKAPLEKHGIKIWVPRRAKSKSTYGGMLDNTVAGGIASGEEPFESLVREADEEASLPEKLVRETVKDCGTITYVHIREARAGGESGLIQPECQYVYDLELPGDVVPKPNDTEVECFYLWNVEEVQAAMGRWEFKPNCALLMLDFFIRWGILNEENEPNYQEIKRRLHRELEFPGPHRSASS